MGVGSALGSELSSAYAAMASMGAVVRLGDGAAVKIDEDGESESASGMLWEAESTEVLAESIADALGEGEGVAAAETVNIATVTSMGLIEIRMDADGAVNAAGGDETEVEGVEGQTGADGSGSGGGGGDGSSSISIDGTPKSKESKAEAKAERDRAKKEAKEKAHNKAAAEKKEKKEKKPRKQPKQPKKEPSDEEKAKQLLEAMAKRKELDDEKWKDYVCPSVNEQRPSGTLEGSAKAVAAKAAAAGGTQRALADEVDGGGGSGEGGGTMGWLGSISSALEGGSNGGASGGGAPAASGAPGRISAEDACWSGWTHVAMGLELNYMQGQLAAISSLLANARCPDDVLFHFPAMEKDEPKAIARLLDHFPNLRYSTYHMDNYDVQSHIAKMTYRSADLANPLNYARIHLDTLLPQCVHRIIYMDTDVIVAGAIEGMWNHDMHGKVVASPEFCQFKFVRYFTDNFWKNETLSAEYQSKKKACYFNPGVMMADLVQWRLFGATAKLLHWMDVNRDNKIYSLGSLPPFLLVFAGNITSLDRSWNTHDLGCGCQTKINPLKVQILHWSCDGKPWRRLYSNKGKKACTVDKVYWQPHNKLGDPNKAGKDRSLLGARDVPGEMQWPPIVSLPAP